MHPQPGPRLQPHKIVKKVRKPAARKPAAKEPASKRVRDSDDDSSDNEVIYATSAAELDHTGHHAPASLLTLTQHAF